MRLYAEQGLLVPAYVDPLTGYRYYASRQLPRARMIARLRRLGLPIARIARLLDLSAEARDAELRAWLHAQAERLAEQTGLVEILLRQADADASGLMAAIATRDVAAGNVIYRQGEVGIEELDAFMAGTEADIRAHLRASGLAGDGSMTVHFHDLVTRDNAGLIEVAIAYQGSAEPVADLRIRLQAVRHEVYLPVPQAYENFPLVLRVYDALEAWLDSHAEFRVTDSPYEHYPGTGEARFDVAYPVSL